MIRVCLPYHLRVLAGVSGEVSLHVSGAVTLRSVLDALETQHPVLRGTIRDHVTHVRRPLLRYFACERDASFLDPDAELPVPIQTGAEPLLIVGSIAGG